MYRGSRSGGGPSSISLGWDEPAPAPRPRTRARTPPGGASSISLGWGNDTGYNPRAKTPPPSRYHDKENDVARSELPRQQAMGRQPRESSNSYACGSQQNVGNVITDKPTTRVRQDPGGASQFSLGWDDAKVPASRPARGAPWQSDIDSQRDADSDAGFLQSTIDSRQNHQSSDIFMMGRPATRGGANQGWDDYSSAPSAQSTAMLRDAQADFFARHRQNEARYSGDDRVSRMADFEGRADSEANPLEDSPRDQRGRSLHHLSKEEPRGVSLPDSDSEAEQGRMEGWGDTQHGPVTPGASSYATSIPAGHSRSDVAFGQRPREGANSFACGRQQNVGNYITERPTTRVAANPGGASSLRLGWDDEGSSSTPRQTNRTPRSAAIGSQSQPDHGIGPDMHGRRPSQDAEDQLKSLKARMAKKQQSTSTPRGSAASIGGDSYASQFSQGREKAEVAGSRPKVWKPALAPQAPPGGAESFGCSYEARFDGRGRVDGAGGAGLNRDNKAIHALRYYQEDFRVGKNRSTEASHQPEKQHVDSHRYFLHEQGQAELKPGKARLSNAGSDVPKQSLLAWQAEAPLPGRRRQRTPPPEAAFGDSYMHRDLRNHQTSRNDADADAYSEDISLDMNSLR